MGRLTGRDENGNVYSREEAWILNANGVINKDEMYKIMMHLAEKLAEYEDLEEQGKLMKLPCAVGDTVWDNDLGRPRSYEVTGFSFGNLNDGCVEEEMILDQVLVHYTNSMGSITGSFAVSEIGKTVFLTPESAEAALKEMRE